VRNGRDGRLPLYRHRNGFGWVDGHRRIPVYTEMMLQVCHNYAGLPDFRTLKLSEIRLFYEGIRGELKRATKTRE